MIDQRQKVPTTPIESLRMTDPIDTNYQLGFFPLLGLYLISSILPFLFLLCFSGMGYGIEVTKDSQSYVDEAVMEVEVLFVLLVFMYLFDEQYWPIPVRVLSWTSIFAAICVTMCLLVAVVPFGPVCIFSVLVPLSIFGIRAALFPNVPAKVLVGWNYRVYVYMGSVILVAFFFWNTINGNRWDSETNAEYSHKVGCAVDFTNLEECENEEAEGVPCFFDKYYEVISFSDTCTAHCISVYQACEEAFIIWSFPNLAAVSLFVMGFISKYLSYLENPNDTRANHHISAVMKFGVIFLFIFWIFASLAGAGKGLSSSLIAFAVSMFIGSSIVGAIVFWNYKLTNATDNLVDGVAKKVESYINILRGLGILVLGPLIVMYLLLSIVNQLVRRSITRHCFKKRMAENEYDHRGYFTFKVDSQIKEMLSWDHVNILSYAIYWGIAYVFLNVLVSKFTTVFLSGLIQYTLDMNLLAVTGIVLAVGMILFMLPPVPGLPIYLTGGIVLVSVGRKTLSLWGAICYACFVSLFLKLLACAIQQKIIGGYLGGIVKVRQMVAINSDGIRAMRVILKDRGMTKRKVAVLVGGPDWPVSVLCGILGLDLLPILFGTLPVFLLIIPTVLTGSFAYMGSIEDDAGVDLYPWADTMGAVASASAAGIMFYFSISAAGAIKDTLEKDRESIESIDLDQEVKEIDAKTERKNKFYDRITVWSHVPFAMKFVISMALISMMGCCYLLFIFNAQCFSEYGLMYTIREHLEGNWTNIVLPLGRLSLVLCIISCILMYTFDTWARKKADMLEKDESGKAEILTDTNATFA